MLQSKKCNSTLHFSTWPKNLSPNPVPELAFFIIPGISGSAILLSIGLYETVISSIATFEVLNLLVFGLGCAASLILMPKLIKKIYEQNSLAMDTFFAGLIFISGIFLW